MKIQELLAEIEIPMGPRGRARIPAPEIVYHSLRGRKLANDGSISGYPLSVAEIELEELFPEVSEDGYVWLSREPYSSGAIRIDATKLDPKNLRYTGQQEGFLIHHGSIPANAIVTVV